MAIVLPLLLLVVGGIVDLGRMFYTELVFANAAREGARVLSLGPTFAGETDTRVQLAASPFVPGTNYTVATAGCPNANGATVTLTSNGFAWTMLNVVPSFFGGSIPAPTIVATGRMRCV